MSCQTEPADVLNFYHWSDAGAFGIRLCNRIHFVNRSLSVFSVVNAKAWTQNKHTHTHTRWRSLRHSCRLTHTHTHKAIFLHLIHWKQQSVHCSALVQLTLRPVFRILYLVRSSSVIEMIKQMSPFHWRRARACYGRSEGPAAIWFR